MKELPKYHETFIPVLETLRTGVSISSKELATRVRKNFYSKLPQELLDNETKTVDITVQFVPPISE